ncbi:MAG: hypothetical protein JHD16_16640 [Solirubrobacteraceae bacterium]|nr:hypothetical protein [Solirubrobacteraceae bacterium]
MITRIKKAPVVALVAAAGLLAGCGGDSDKPNANASGSTPAAADNGAVTSADKATATTPEENWAAKLCTTMAKQAKTVQPPEVDTSSPEATQKGLVKFFVDVGDQLEDQVKAVEKVGPPPGGDAEAAWNRAVKAMKATETKVGDIRQELRAATPDSAAELNAVVAKLGDQMKVLNEYQGPVADLSKEDTLATALSSEPACAKVS